MLTILNDMVDWKADVVYTDVSTSAKMDCPSMNCHEGVTTYKEILICFSLCMELRVLIKSP